MKFSHFFRASWLFQLLVGIALFSVSFLIELDILKNFVQSPWIALLLASSMEVGKAVAIIWHRYLSYRHDIMGYPALMRVISGTFRFGLVFFSMLCSLLFFSNTLDRPNLEKVRQQQLNEVESRLESRLAQLERDRNQRLEHLREKHQEELENNNKTFRQNIRRLESELSEEMDNVVNRNFKGPRYKDIAKRLEKEKTSRASTLESVIKRQNDSYDQREATILRDYQQQQKQALAEADARKAAIRSNSYIDSEEANDTRITSFLNVFGAVFSTQPTPLQFVFLLAILISFLVELGIILSFDTITLTILPAITASHAADIQQDLLDEEMQQQQRQERKQHDQSIQDIRKHADQVIKKAEDYMQDNDRDLH